MTTLKKIANRISMIDKGLPIHVLKAGALPIALVATAGFANPIDNAHQQGDVTNPDLVTPQVANGTEPAVDDWRYDAVAAFSRTNWFNGVVHEHNNFCSGTLISPDTVLLADHCLSSSYSETNPPPAELYSLRFRRNPDGSLGTVAQGWQSFHHVTVDHFTFPDTNNDIIIAHLSEPVMHIDPICIGDASTLEADDDITFAGWGFSGSTFNGGTKEKLLTADSVVTSVTSTRVNFPSAFDPNNPCGCGPNNHDSGGAVLVEVPPRAEGDLPQLELVGVIITTGSAVIPDVHQLVDANTCYCPADLYTDGVLDIFDVTEFLTLYNAADPYADWNGDGTFNFFDVDGFLDDFAEGCP